jgi:hypothetical protein
MTEALADIPGKAAYRVTLDGNQVLEERIEPRLIRTDNRPLEPFETQDSWATSRSRSRAAACMSASPDSTMTRPDSRIATEDCSTLTLPGMIESPPPCRTCPRRHQADKASEDYPDVQQLTSTAVR